MAMFPIRPLDPTQEYYAMTNGVIYHLAPSRKHPGYWFIERITLENSIAEGLNHPVSEDTLESVAEAWG